MRHRFCTVLFLALGLASFPACGQLFSVGIKAGVPLNDGFTNSDSLLSSTTNRYIIGPQIELRLPFHLGVEADALYRHYVVSGKGASEWDFPILLKYRFKGVPLVAPFVDAGPIFNHVSQIDSATPNQSTAGFLVGGGLDFHALIVHISPEFRYVHWGNQNYNFAALGSSLVSSQNQAQFLVGLTF
jgi:hypothetical protein